MTKIRMVANALALAVADPTVVPFIDVHVSSSAALMVDAYRGTIDWSDGDDEVVAQGEIEATVSGEYGDFLSDASLALLDAVGQPISQIACSLFEGAPTILFVYTAASQKGKGLASRLIKASAAALVAMGHSEVALYVTEGNPAQGLYENLGFKVG